jgi:hypothetical protein
LRTEDEAGRRAFYLRRAAGLTGRLSQAWRRLVERDPPDKALRLVRRPKDLMSRLLDDLEYLDDALDDINNDVKTLATGEGRAIEGAAARTNY